MTIPVKHYQFIKSHINHIFHSLKKLEPFLEPEPEAIGPAAIVSPQDPNPREQKDAKNSSSPPIPTGSASKSIFCLLAFGNKKLVPYSCALLAPLKALSPSLKRLK